MPEKITAQVGDKVIAIETGKVAKQADGSVIVQLGETIVIVAAVAASKVKEGQDFFPLTVDYREKAAAAGKFPGGYFKREGRPTEKEILTSRLTDRPIRPLFPKGMYNEVQVQSIVLSADGQNDPDVLSIVGASTALMVSDIPWNGPLGAVRVGRVSGKFVANPTHAERHESDLDLIYVGNEKEVVMFEGSAKEVSEADFMAALQFGHEACQPLIQAQKQLVEKIGRKKRQISLRVVPEDILKEAKALAGDRIVPALLTPGKLAREEAVKVVFDEVGVKLKEKFGEEKVTDFVLKDAAYYLQKEAVRSLILDQNKRLDGRSFDQIRPISSEVALLPRAHGSALFTRGETQAIALATLGTSEDAQEFDSYTGGENEKKFILHYNFPNFSVGETGRISGPGRREIGHGALAERSLEPVLPLKDYPYAIRVTCEIMESNGSSSMASVCSGTLALMDAGVPMIRPVAGHPRPHGRRRADDPSGGRHQHGRLHGIQRAARDLPLPVVHRHHRLGRRLLRHGLQDRRHRKGHHGLPTRPQTAGPAHEHHGRGFGEGPRGPSAHPGRDGQDPGRAARGTEQVRAAHRHGQDQSGKDRRADRPWRQEHQEDRGRVRLRDQY
ncbi:MAG: polyribonucleotide nucleotidyltransferase, partial [Verrucomicrobia bacterium]|nr:polyribonucleotide nucleotidyltransferase [Verrucomicrobiota bacterium]